YHLVNLTLHFLSAWLLWELLTRLLRAPRAPDSLRASAPFIAAATSALWLVHPLLVDAVTYVIQRTELLMSFFLLATLLGSLRGATGRARWNFLAVLACFLGVGSKEAMAGAPLLVVLMERAFVFGTFRAAFARRRGFYLALFASWIPLALIVASGPRDETAGFDVGVAWWRYLLTQGAMILHYLRLAFWPEGLVIDHGKRLVESVSEWLPGVLVVGALFLVTCWATARRPLLGFAGACFFLILAPSSSIVPILTEVGAERRMYLPLAALLALVMLGLWRLVGLFAERERARRLALAAVVALLVLPATAATIARNAVFRSELSIWEDAVHKLPENPGARNNLGRVYTKLGRLEDALAQFQTAVQLPDCGVDAYTNLALALADLGRLEEAEAYLRSVVADNPDFAKGHEYLASILMRREKWSDARAAYETCLRLGRRSASILNDHARTLFKLGRLEDSIAQLEAALRLDPTHALAQANLEKMRALQAGR
ncbi:MAG: tetratricopeptide repeat protein, partial [Planctomycetota bacterium]